jgi:hypothetical protein
MNNSSIQGIKATNVPAVNTNVVFWILLFGEVMSIPCYLFMFYHLLRRRVTRQTLQNHAIFLLLSYNFMNLIIDLSLTLDYLRLGYRSLFVPFMCLLQAYVDYGIWYGAIFLMLWVSIERHILIFHSTLVATARGRFLFHYIPLAIFSLYAPILYFYLIILCPCNRIYNRLRNFCGIICYHNIVPAWFDLFESLFNYIIPILLIAVFSVSLIIRAIVQKRRLQRAVGWRYHRKMIIQLILISSVYTVFDLPYVIYTIVQWAGISTFAGEVISQYFPYLTYVPAIIVPYTTLMALPELKQKFRALIIWNTNQRGVAPLTGGT